MKVYALEIALLILGSVVFATLIPYISQSLWFIIPVSLVVGVLFAEFLPGVARRILGE